MNLGEAEVLAKELMSLYVPKYRFRWMNEKTVNGRCFWDNNIIELSRPLTQLRTKAAVENTIMHEIAHALTPGDYHGAKWQNQMRKFGLKPERCSSDDVDRSSISNWEAVCKGCGKKFHMIRKPRLDKSCSACGGRKFNRKYLLMFYRI
jgi:SprT protein